MKLFALQAALVVAAAFVAPAAEVSGSKTPGPNAAVN